MGLFILPHPGFYVVGQILAVNCVIFALSLFSSYDAVQNQSTEPDVFFFDCLYDWLLRWRHPILSYNKNYADLSVNRGFELVQLRSEVHLLLWVLSDVGLFKTVEVYP